MWLKKPIQALPSIRSFLLQPAESAGLWLLPIMLCLAALLTLLGATWLDLLLQHHNGRSAWDDVSYPPAQPQITSSPAGDVIAIPGTGPNKESIQDDLSAVILNNALPLELLHIFPLTVPYYSVSAVHDSPRLSTYIVVTTWWCVLFLCLLVSATSRELIRNPYLKLAHQILVVVAVCFPLTYGLFIFLEREVPGTRSFLILLYLLAATVFVCTPVLVLTSLLLRPFAIAGTFSLREVLFGALSATLILLVGLGIIATISLWLGWYTLDIRVNLLEVAWINVAPLIGFVLLMVVVTGLLYKAAAATLPLVMAIGIFVLALSYLPLPPRLTNDEAVVLLNEHLLVKYAEPSEVVAEQIRAIFPETPPFVSGMLAINAANLFSHVPVWLSWIRPFLMGLAFVCSAACVVAVAHSAGHIIRAAAAVACNFDRSIGMALPAILLTTIVSVGPLVYVGRWIERTLASHGIERVLMLSPSSYTHDIYALVVSYYPDRAQIPRSAKLYVRETDEFRRAMLSLMTHVASLRNDYYLYGGADWVSAPADDELKRKRSLLAEMAILVRRQRDLAADMPETLQRQLRDSGVSAELASAAAENWSVWLANRLTVLEAEAAELSSHMQYIDALSAASRDRLVSTARGAVILQTGADSMSSLVKLRLDGIERTLRLEELRAKQELSFLDASEQAGVMSARYDGFVNDMRALAALLRCFLDPSAFLLDVGSGRVRWKDERFRAPCDAAGERVDRAQRGIL